MSKISLEDIVTFSNNGVSSATYMEIVDAYREAMQKLYGNDIDVSDASADGQYIMALSLALYNMGGVVSALYKNLNPFIASGKYLDIISSWSNIYRKSASSAVCHLVVSVPEGSTLVKNINEYLLYNQLDGTTWKNNNAMNISGGTNVLYVNSAGQLTVDGETAGYYYKKGANYLDLKDFIENEGEITSIINNNGYISINELYDVYKDGSTSEDPKVQLEFKPLNVIEFECTSTGESTNNNCSLSYDVEDLNFNLPILTIANRGPVSSMVDINSPYMFWQIDDATGGTNDESDEELRTRRFITNYGKSTVDNLKTSLMDIYGVRDVYIINNNSSGDAIIDKNGSDVDIKVSPYSTYISIRTYESLTVDYTEIAKTIYNNLSFGASTNLTMNGIDIEADTSTNHNGSIIVKELTSFLGSGETSTDIVNHITFKANSYVNVKYEDLIIYISNELNTDYVKTELNYQLKKIIDDVTFGEKFGYREGVIEAISAAGLDVSVYSLKANIENEFNNENEGINEEDNFVIPKTTYLKMVDFVSIDAYGETITNIPGYTAYVINKSTE